MRWVSLILLILFLSVSVASAQQGLPEDPLQDLVDTTEEQAQAFSEKAVDFFNRLLEPPENVTVRLLLIFGGLVLLFLGWRVSGFIIIIIGTLVGVTLTARLLPELELDLSPTMQIAASIAGGIFGATTAAQLYYVAVMIIGGYTGMVVVTVTASILSLAPVSITVLAFAALMGGLILAFFAGQILILVSALVGAQMLTLGLLLDRAWLFVFAAIGVLVQMLIIRAFNVEVRGPRRSLFAFRR